ncbi:MAG: LysR substrate-binding domain-containing protein [Castellaniella sp.]
MNIRQLQYFVVLAQELNFTRAAERLHISQPPLSRQIAQLEASLKLKLFTRSSRRVALTESGEVFLVEAQLILQRLENARARARAVEEGLQGAIELGLSGSHFMGPLPGLIARYGQKYPDVSLRLNEIKPVEQQHALMERRIDLSISRIPVNDNILRSVSLWSDPTVVAYPRGYKDYPPDTKLRVRDIAQEQLILLRHETSGFAQMIHERCLAYGAGANVVQTVNEVPSQIHLVAAGVGMAIVPLSVCPRLPEVDWRYLDEFDIRTDVYGVMRVDTRKRAIDRFIQLIVRDSSVARGASA